MFKSRMASPIPIGEGFSPATWMSASGQSSASTRSVRHPGRCLPDLQGRLHTVTAVEGPRATCQDLCRLASASPVVECGQQAFSRAVNMPVHSVSVSPDSHSGVATAVCTMGFTLANIPRWRLA